MKRKLERLTVDAMLDFEPCADYTHRRLKELWGRKTYLTALDILALDIPVEDRIWAITETGIVAENLLQEFVCRCAERALRKEVAVGRKPPKASYTAIKTKRAWLAGNVTARDLDTVYDAAWRAADNTAGLSAATAAEAAAWTAGPTACVEETMSAAAESIAGWHRERQIRRLAIEKEYKWQIRLLIRMIKKGMK